MNTLILRGTLASTLLLSTAGAFAQETDTLDTVVVTASRVAQTENEALVPITVIDREDIERYQSQSLNDILRRVPGLTITSNGGRGQSTSVFLRGSSSKQVLVLIDGVPVRSTSLNVAPYASIPVSQIEKIEVVRGPRSSLYGSAGIGGVIQIFTRTGSGAPKPFAEISAGSYGRYGAQAGFSGKEGNTRYNLSVGGEEVEGFDVNTQFEDDKDGYRTTNGSVKVGHQFNDKLDAEFSALVSDNSVEYDSSFSNSTDRKLATIGARATITPTDNLAVDVNVGRYQQKEINYLQGEFNSLSDSSIDNAGIQTDIAISDKVSVLVGGEYLDENLESSFGSGSRYNIGGYTQTSLNAGRFDAQLNLRRDLFEGLNSKNTGSIAFGFDLTNEIRLLTSYGEAFRYGSISAGVRNPSLRPEYAKNYEIGARFARGVFTSSINIYNNDVTDEIIFDGVINNFVNLSSLIRGGELTLGANLEKWVTNFTFSRIDAENRSSGSQLVKRPKYSAKFDLDRYLGAHSLGLSVTSSAGSLAFRSSTDADQPKVGSYTIVDLRGAYQLSEAWSLNAIWSNIGDKEYQTAKNFSQPGSALNLALRYQP